MAKFFGKVGYGTSIQTAPHSGVWVDQIVEFEYYGEVMRDTTSLQAGAGLNEDISVSNSISIVADQYAVENFANIKYVEWNGSLWAVTNVEVRRPRLILSLGKVYNGPTP